MGESYMSGAITTTSSTVVDGYITINPATVPFNRVYLISASWTTDVSGVLDLQESASFGVACVTTATSTTVTSAGLFDSVNDGMQITGTGIPANTHVASKTDSSTITITQAATQSNNPVTLTFKGATRFRINSEPRGTAFAQDSFIPSEPIPIFRFQGGQPLFVLNCTATGRLSVSYTYGL